MSYDSRSRMTAHRRIAMAMVLLGLWSCSGSSSSQGVASVAVNITCTPSGGDLVIHVCGNRLVDGNGHTVQLRGVSVSGLEGYAIQGWTPGDPWGGQAPDFAAIKSWGANAVRLPLNEASWNGGPCID